MRHACWILASLLAAAAACDSSNDSDEGRDPGPEVATDPGPEVSSDVLPDPGRDTTPADPGIDGEIPVTDPGSDAIEPPPGRYGFTFRLPQIRDVPFTLPDQPETTQPKPDIDLLCTFVHGTTSGYLYVQSTPLNCAGLQGCNYTTSGAWLSLGGVAYALVDAVYDYGGNHHNDWIRFPFEENLIRYSHSTFGYGGIPCQPLDCLQVLSDVDQSILEDGCTVQRTLPVACVEIPLDGTLPDFPTTFQPCPSL